MGLAANQVRLLTLQSRMNDLEYQCMKYSSEEVALAMKSGSVSEEYHRRLDQANNMASSGFSYFNVRTGEKAESVTRFSKLNTTSGQQESVKVDYNYLTSRGYLLYCSEDANDNYGSYILSAIPSELTRPENADALMLAIAKGQVDVFYDPDGLQTGYGQNNWDIYDVCYVSISDIAAANGLNTTKEAYLDSSEQYVYTADYSQRDKKRQEAEDYYERETNKLSQQEKMIGMLSRNANTQYQTACTEYESVKSLIKDNTDRSFSIFG